MEKNIEFECWFCEKVEICSIKLMMAQIEKV